jgi:lipopolysaccharide cholinephosphotransferase
MELSLLKELQQAELGILLDVQAICKRNDITFYLAFGSLIGAVRHGGFIPWDDDIDIIMFRDHFERFLDVAEKELDKKYGIEYFSTTSAHWNFHAKVRLLGECKFKFSDDKYSDLEGYNGPFIDIFIWDYFPEKKSFQQFIYSWIAVILHIMVVSKNTKDQPRPFLKRLLIKSLNLILKPISNNTLGKIIIRICKKWHNSTRNYVCPYCNGLNSRWQICPISKFGEPQYINFEGYNLPIPHDYDYILKLLYGDYMKLPPENEREPKHIWNIREE